MRAGRMSTGCFGGEHPTKPNDTGAGRAANGRILSTTVRGSTGNI